MKFTHLLTAMCCAMSLVSCGREKQTGLFDYSDPVDLSAILQAYDWYQHYEGDDKDSILYTKMNLCCVFLNTLAQSNRSLPTPRISTTAVPCHGTSGATMRYGTEGTRQTCYATMMKSRIASRRSTSISSKTRTCVRQHRFSRTPSSNS